MTYPVGTPPSEAYVEGTVSDAQGHSEESIRNGLKQQIKGFGQAQSGFGSLFAGIAEWLTNLNAVVDEQVTEAGEITEGLTDLTNRVEVLEGGAVTVRTYAFNDVWTKPDNLIRLGVAVECGGSSGRTGSTIRANIGGLGGLSGGYRFQWFDQAAIANDIGATENIVIGAGGNTPSQLGGVSRFGNHVVGVPGIGAVLTVEGSQTSNSSAGRGGDGGNGANANTGIQFSGGEAGGDSAFASGGVGGSTAGSMSGGNGADAVISPTTRGNGGGGGGGGGSGAAGVSGGVGGNGGFPAGPGGGGGARSAGLGSSDGPGGLGADGRVTILEYRIVEGP